MNAQPSNPTNRPAQPSRSGRRRILMALTLIILLTVGVNLAWWVYYLRVEAQFAALLNQRLCGLARVASATLTPQSISDLVRGDIFAYSDICDELETLAEAEEVSEIFILSLDYRVLASSAPEADSVYPLASINRAAIEAAFAGADTTVAISEQYRIGEIILRSAFAPLQDDSSATIATLGVEANISYGDTLFSLRRNLYLSTFFSVLAAFVFGVTLILFERRSARAEKAALESEAQMALGRMVAVVSHEIKNPLAIMRSAAERVRKKSDIEEASYIIEEVDRLNDIVTGYLDFARSPAPKDVRATPIEEILTHIGELFATMRPRLESKGIKFTVTLPPSGAIATGELTFSPQQIRVMMDTRAIRQALMNLILNASDAALTRGVDSGRASVTVGATLQTAALLIVVTDNGPGIPTKYAAQVFEPFFTTKQSGSGLGLHLTRSLVEGMGGTISLESPSGGPTRFRMVFPLLDDNGK